MAIAIAPNAADIAVGASQDFVFSGKTGAEYFVDIPLGADKCTLVKINSTTWRVTRTAAGDIRIRGSESPFGDNFGRVIGNDDGQTTLGENGRMTLGHLNAATVYSYLSVKLTAVGAFVTVNGTPLFGSNGTSFQMAAVSGWGGAGWLDLNNAADEWKIEKSGADKVKYYKNGAIIGNEITTTPGDIGIIFAVAPANSNLGYVFPRWEFGGAVSHYSEAVSGILGIPPQPINIGFTVPASINDGDVLIPENLTTNATGFEWRVSNILRSTDAEPDLAEWLNLGNNTIKLTATNPAYTEYLTKNVVLLAPGEVNFTVPELEVGKSFSITNQSTNTNIFSIDFGDGTISNDPLTLHNFSEIGIKTISLTAIFTNLSITKSKEVYVYPSGFSWLIEELRMKSQSAVFPLLSDSEIISALKNAVETDDFGNILSLWADRTGLINKLLGELWMLKAAKASAMIETANTQEGLRNSNQQIYEHCLEMAKIYGSKEMGTFLSVSPN